MLIGSAVLSLLAWLIAATAGTIFLGGRAARRAYSAFSYFIPSAQRALKKIVMVGEGCRNSSLKQIHWPLVRSRMRGQYLTMRENMSPRGPGDFAKLGQLIRDIRVATPNYDGSRWPLPHSTSANAAS